MAVKLRLPKEILIGDKTLQKILDLHELWLRSLHQSGVKAVLNGANLTGTDLSGATLSEADLSDSNLSYANLRGADLTYANLSGVDLRKARVSVARLGGANLSRANLSQANLIESNLSQADLEKADLSCACLTMAILIYVNLSGANLRGADLRRAILNEAYLSYADLTDANLSGSHFLRAKLRAANLHNASASRVKFNKADLREANLQLADLFEADLSLANLEKANLSEANIKDANLSHTDLTRTKLLKAHFTGVAFHETITFSWIIDGVNCDYIFLDQRKKERFPKDRNFEPGEFEKNYAEIPTIEERAVLSNEITELKKRLNELEIFSYEASNSGGIFISHSHTDKDVVSHLTSRFDKKGIQYWLDEKEMLVGQVIDKAISEGIQKSWLFLILLTPSSITSKWVEREFDEASHEEVEGGKIILPVIAKGLKIESLPPRIRRKLCVDLTTDYDRGYEKLEKSILTYLKNFASLRNSEKQERAR
jgi:uncharacterized protein YjbI with pentapeptide repeats